MEAEPSNVVSSLKKNPSAAEESTAEEPLVLSMYNATTVANFWNWSICHVHFLLIHAGIDDLVEVTDYLLDLEKTDIYNLGLALKLKQPEVKKMRDSETFRDDMIAAWLEQKEDQVAKKGEPTWETLVKALKNPRVKLTEIAEKIQKDKQI